MKWPQVLALIRHEQSAYNILKEAKQEDRDYQEFLKAYDQDWQSKRTRKLAQKIWQRFGLECGDWNTKLTPMGHQHAHATGVILPNQIELPDTVFVSPYLRTRQTYDNLVRGWPELGEVRLVVEDRLREQEHGLATVYNDWKVFHALHPEQKLLRDKDGSYYYRFPQGENVPDVIERMRSFIGTLTRDYSEKRVLVVTHHLTILAFMAAIQRWDSQEFIQKDEQDKPPNGSLTVYRGDPNVGTDGKLVLDFYGRQLYTD